MTSLCDLAPFTAHGGRVEVARSRFGGADWIDLSTGIAPWSWPIGDVSLGLDTLPEPSAIAALEAAAAQAFEVADPKCVVAVPGTDLALRMLATVLGAERVAVVEPGYAGHRAAWPAATAVLIEHIADPADSDLLVLANPANPDGRETDPALLRTLAGPMRVLVDEAYADPAPGLAPGASDRLIVLRSFGKFYGLPGVRLGFCIAGPVISADLRALLGDWPVSGPAVAIGTAAYRDAGWRRAQALRIRETGLLLDRVIADAGLAVVGQASLFRLIACADAGRLFETLARHAILTRPFADQPTRLRIGLPRGTAALMRLATALEEFVA